MAKYLPQSNKSMKKGVASFDSCAALPRLLTRCYNHKHVFMHKKRKQQCVRWRCTAKKGSYQGTCYNHIMYTWLQQKRNRKCCAINCSQLTGVQFAELAIVMWSTLTLVVVALTTVPVSAVTLYSWGQRLTGTTVLTRMDTAVIHAQLARFPLSRHK